jgi:putative transposase
LPATVIGRWFYLYLLLHLYRRKIVGWEVHDSDHCDHGSTLKATMVLAMLGWVSNPRTHAQG